MMITMNTLLVLALTCSTLATPLIVHAEHTPPPNSTYVKCHEGTTDPICKSLKPHHSDVITEIFHSNGTKEVKRNLYTRDELKAFRLANGVQTIKRSPGDQYPDGAAESVSDLAERETAPPVCHVERQSWFDQKEWGYWYQEWKQVGNCFYCNSCTEAIAASFSVSQSWTVNLGATFDGIIEAQFSFSWGETQSLTDTRTCQWSKGDTYGCHSIWYQPLMTYHNGNVHYQTHKYCSASSGQPASNTYYDHHSTYANINQAANPGNHGVNQGNLGCDSGCQGKDHRACKYGNNGGSLWPKPNK